MANKYLLTGAGFSKSFGALLCEELTCKFFNLLIEDKNIQKEILKYSDLKNFEAILSDIRRNYHDKIRNFEIVLERVFEEITSCMKLEKDPNQIVPSPDNDLGNFLVKFDQIFTLNQDTFIDNQIIDNQKIIGNGISGILGKIGESAPEYKNIKSQLIDKNGNSKDGKWYVKLHGSHNWKNEDKSLMIFGTSKDKVEYINSNSLFEEYFGFFEESLKKPNSKLVIIGYSFCDPHVNGIISEAVKSGLEIFIWDPKVLELIGKSNGNDQKFITNLKESLRGYLVDGFSLMGTNKDSVFRFLEI